MLYVLATNSTGRSAAMCDYLRPRLDADDVLHALNSQRGGDHTTSAELDRGRDALAVVNDRLSTVTTVETHQFVRGNDPATDVLRFVDRREADELVFAIRKRSAIGTVLFGSVAQDLLTDADVPMRVVPVAAAE
ncbi:universal stress protein [Halobaculum halobium]|uniref:Universal stress protein n=2 Tax=Halobaculum halobium TaxID=3032281 RepID=A0ABD5TE90_9EURY